MWVISPCKRSRLGELLAMLESIQADPEKTVVITTQPDPITHADLSFQCHLLQFPEPGMLFGQWFNLGLDFIASRETGNYEVLCIGSSLTGSPQAVQELMRALAEGHSMVGPDLHGRIGRGEIYTLPPVRTVHDRVPGMCFMLRGQDGLRFDPQFRWWYSDDDLEMQARQLGPVALAGNGFHYPTQHPLNETQAIQASEDREKYIEKWGCEPW